MAKHYIVEGKNIIADVAKLNEKELAAVRNYIALGFSLVEPKKEKKDPKEEFKAEVIQAWLEENGTKAQIAHYWDLYNAPVVKEGETLYYAKDCKMGKKGEPKKKGHIATLNWFKKEFPKYAKTPEEIEKMEKEAAEADK